MPLKPGQLRKYWATWRQVARILSGRGLDDSDIEAARKELHLKIGAGTASSKDLAGDQLTAILLEFHAITDPADLDTQIAHHDPTTRKRIHAIQAMGHADHWLDKIARDRWGKSPWRTLPADAMRILHIDLEQRRRRAVKKAAKQPADSQDDLPF